VANGGSNVPNLVLDVGMHNGDDTAYYLASGYDVVAVEANPTLCASARDRFALRSPPDGFLFGT
jgi:hypothetical protein